MVYNINKSNAHNSALPSYLCIQSPDIEPNQNQLQSLYFSEPVNKS